MALITSAASGNFNVGATWTGGVVPGVGDEARASTGHTVTIAANTTCTEISNAGTGTFVLNSGVTLTANVTPKGSVNAHCLTFSAASPAVSYVAGNVVGNSVSGSNSTYGIVVSGTGTLNITGTVTGGASTGSGAVNNTSSGIINITGNVTGGPSSGNSFGAQNASTGTITITGNVTSGITTGNFGVNNTSTGPVTIIGNVTGLAVAGVNNASSGTLTITGDCTASTTANAVNSTSATPRVSGSFISASNGRLAVNASAIILLTTPTAARTRYALNGTGTFIDMFTADNTGLAPAVGDVRAGVVYGSATGVLAVPAASSVAFGVAVDNTTGTAVLTPAAVWSYASRTTTGGTVDILTTAPSVPSASAIADEVWNRQASAITTTNSIGERVKNTATTAIVGNLLAQANS